MILPVMIEWGTFVDKYKNILQDTQKTFLSILQQYWREPSNHHLIWRCDSTLLFAVAGLVFLVEVRDEGVVLLNFGLGVVQVNLGGLGKHFRSTGRILDDQV